MHGALIVSCFDGVGFYEENWPDVPRCMTFFFYFVGMKLKCRKGAGLLLVSLSNCAHALSQIVAL